MTLKLNVVGDLKPVAYRDIPIGAVFTFIEHYKDIPGKGIIYLKGVDQTAVILNGPNIGFHEEEEEFISGDIWLILDATLTINK